ncbi:MAG: Holliday junction resolvase RuvX [Proteobacteria bacterium]|nr:Holliday junction resolvase RuvX [Pseudomonadota bacterium]
MPETATDHPASGRPLIVIGFDYGRRRIGAARGDTLTRRASPLATVDNGPREPDWGAIGRLLALWQPALIVVGLPYNADGSEGPMADEAREFALALTRRFPLQVEFVDERYSSLDAQERLTQARATGSRRHRVDKVDIDAGAAVVILERWLDAFTTG